MTDDILDRVRYMVAIAANDETLHWDAGYSSRLASVAVELCDEVERLREENKRLIANLTDYWMAVGAVPHGSSTK